MTNGWREIEGLTVEINEVLYVPTLEAPADKPYPFVYFVAIKNDSAEEVTIHGRKWVVTEEDGSVAVLEGDGVVGQRPVLPPGDRFSYNSYHVVAGSGRASGAYFGLTKGGERFRVAIPEFVLELPEWKMV